MKLPKELTTATKLSKYLAMVLFIALPFVGFFLGVRYQEMMDLAKNQEMGANFSILRSPTPIDETANWKTYINKKYEFSFKYSDKWGLESSPRNRGKDVNTVDSVRFYNLSERLKSEKHQKDCEQKVARGATECAGRTDEETLGYYINIIENTSKLNQEEFFKTLSHLYEKGEESVGNLTVIKGFVNLAGGGVAYYFSNPTQTFAVVIEKDYEGNIDESLKTIDAPIYQILATFKFTK